MSDDYNKEATDLLHEQIFKALERIEKQTTITNGKVRRIYLYLTATAAFTLGLGIVELNQLAGLLL